VVNYHRRAWPTGSIAPWSLASVARDGERFGGMTEWRVGKPISWMPLPSCILPSAHNAEPHPSPRPLGLGLLLPAFATAAVGSDRNVTLHTSRACQALNSNSAVATGRHVEGKNMTAGSKVKRLYREFVQGIHANQYSWVKRKGEEIC